MHIILTLYLHYRRHWSTGWSMTLAEDWQSNGDITSQAVIPPNAQAHAIIRARRLGVLAGLDLARRRFAPISD